MSSKSWSSVQTEQKCSGINDISNDDSDDNSDDNSDDDRSKDNVNTNPNTLFYAMKNMLNIPRNETLSSRLIADYDCSSKIPELKGLLLSKKGLVQASHPLHDKSEYYLQFCNECLKSLQKGTKDLSYKLPPPHAIANHFFVGYMPDNLFHGATWVENAMTSLVTSVASTRIVRGGVRRAIRSHVLVFGAIPGPPATLLPRKLEDDSHFRVILAGPFTAPQMDRIRQQHLVRQSMCIDLLSFYRYNNHFYREMEYDRILLKNMPEINNPDDMFDRINELHVSSDIVDLIDIQQQRVNNRSTSTDVSERWETTIVEKTVVFVDTEVDKSVLATKVAKEPIFTVHSSNVFVNENEIAQMFPHLFP